MPDDLFLAIQEAIETRCGEIDYLAGLPVVLEDKGDVDAMTRQIIEQQGLLIYIATPEATDCNANIEGLYSFKISPVVQIYEVPEINRRDSGTQKPAGMVALYVGAAFSQYTPPDLGMISVDRDRGLRSIRQGKMIIWEVALETHGGVKLT